MSFSILVTNTIIPVDEMQLDRRARQDILNYGGIDSMHAAKGIGCIRWQSPTARESWWQQQRLRPQAKQARVQDVVDYANRMQQGEFPPFAHVYLHPSLTGVAPLMVIDGTRRTVAYLEAGFQNIPVLVFRRKPIAATGNPPSSA